MVTTSHLALFFFATFFLIASNVQAESAEAPEPHGPLNITGILDKAGQYTTFISLLKSSQVGDQINTQLNSSDQGMTVLAPTDNAFNTLKAGTLNDLSTQEQISLILYHVLPKYYSKDMLDTVSNPVQTLATNRDGGKYNLNFTSGSNQYNVSTGIVDVQLNNMIREKFPLAVYNVDKVLLPLDLFGPDIKKASPPPAPAPTKKDAPSTKAAHAPVTAEDKSGAGRMILQSCLSLGLGLACMNIFW